MKPSEIKKNLEVWYQPSVRRNVVNILVGEPGIGKTEMVRQFAKEKGVNIVTLICSQQLPNEIVGSSAPNISATEEAEKIMEYFPPNWYVGLKDGDILFLDELFTAPKNVLEAMLTLIQSRLLQNKKYLPDVMIIAASNPLGSAGQLNGATRNRFQKIDVEFDQEESAKYLADKYGGDWKLIAKLIKKNQAPAWNELTPRTAEKLIIQIEAMVGDKTDLVPMGGEVNYYFESIYDYTVARDVINWWNDRADKIANRQYYDKVKQVNKDPLDVIKPQLFDAVLAAVKEDPMALPGYEVKRFDDIPAQILVGYIERDDIGQHDREVITTMKNEMDAGRPASVGFIPNQIQQDLCDKYAKEYNEECIEVETSNWFMNADTSDIIGTLEGTPIWDNIKSILENIKLVEVEV